MTLSDDSQVEVKESIYSARWVFPIDRPPIHGGFVRIVGDRITEVNSLQNAKLHAVQTHDLGDVALLPKLVNAHTHLEFSDCENPIGDPGIPLYQWIGLVIRSRGQSTLPEREASVALGLAESANAGVGWIGDIATTPTRYPTSRSHVVSFAEVLGLSPGRGEERFTAAVNHRQSLESDVTARFGISPHAPYSTPEPLMERCVALARANGVPLAMHLAESPEERVLLETGAGGFADSLHAGGLWRNGLFPHRAPKPIESIIDRLGAAPRVLLVHGNDLNDTEIDRIARFPQITVVYCPRTHAFFGHAMHPVAKLLRADVPVAIGTDSRASNPDLSVWREMQFLLDNRSDLDPAEVLRMVTANGGDALLGRQQAIACNAGRIGVGRGGIDDFAVVPTMASAVDQVWRDFAAHELSCIDANPRQ